MSAPLELATLKARQPTVWASGDYAGIGISLQIVGEQLAVACDQRWGERVLDVTAGHGDASGPDSFVVASEHLEVVLNRR